MDIKTQYSTILDNQVQLEIWSDDGWFKLVCEMLNELEQLNEPMKIIQIKEKYGSLRVHSYTVTNNQSAIIKKYKKIASVTCERCGNTGSHYTGPQFYDNGVFCDKCITKMNLYKVQYNSDCSSDEQ